jgi:hypothetical protein
MIDTLNREDLLSAVVEHVGQWPAYRRDDHGFGLLCGSAPELAERRRHHARKILLTTATLEQLASRTEEPMVIMKGLEVAQLYSSPLHRPFQDLDLLVLDPERHWHDAVTLGYRPSPYRRMDIDHHHLPPLAHPAGGLGVEFHIRPNVPGWMGLDRALIFDTAVASRLPIANVLRPRDDIHALLLAGHCWKGGFARLRDLLDALLLSSSSGALLNATNYELGLDRFWEWTVKLAEAELLGQSSLRSSLMRRALRLDRPSRRQRKFARVVAPYFVSNPMRVTRVHMADHRLGRAARAGRNPNGHGLEAGSPSSSMSAP